MNFTELSAALSEMGLPSYRTKQIYSWIHQKCALDYDEMTNLPLSLRERLKEELPLKKCTIERKQVSAEDGTVKYLFGFGGNEYAESVLMKYKYGYTICVSTQIGCGMLVLRLHLGRICQKPAPVGNTRPDIHRSTR